jgi:flagellar hook-length control protein FliK
MAPQAAKPAHEQPTAAASPVASDVPNVVSSQQLAGQPGFQQGTPDEGRQQLPSKPATSKPASASISETAPAPADARLLASAQAAPVLGVPSAAPTQAAAVVAQIASHVDLYGVPGGKTVHIQLHPEGLGGVEVTVRYSPAGGVELHINVEQAATGTLVQAGWTQLRDALGTQGITADRLVMNVTTAGSANADLSGGGSNDNRSDPTLTNFNQNQNNQNNQTNNGQSGQQQAGARSWEGGRTNGAAASDDSQDGAASSVAPTRIDYRV